MQLHKLACSYIKACMQFLSSSEQLTRISQCLLRKVLCGVSLERLKVYSEWLNLEMCWCRCRCILRPILVLGSRVTWHVGVLVNILALIAECEMLMVISSHDLTRVDGGWPSYFYYLIVHFAAGTLNQFSGKALMLCTRPPPKLH